MAVHVTGAGYRQLHDLERLVGDFVRTWPRSGDYEGDIDACPDQGTVPLPMRWVAPCVVDPDHPHWTVAGSRCRPEWPHGADECAQSRAASTKRSELVGDQ
jgi:hypothetical protein